MEQSKIWQYFQNQADHDPFDRASARYRYLARRIRPGHKTLNIGVGRGGLERLLLAKGVDVHALDPSDASIESLRKLGLEDKAMTGYSHDIPCSDGSFDVVVISEVLEHLDSAKLDRTLAEVRRVLRDGGQMIGTVPANEVLQDNTVVCPECGKVFHRWGHVQSFSREAVETLLTKHQFASISAKYHAFPDWRRRSLTGLAKSVIRYVLGKLGVSISQPGILFCATR